MILGFSLVLTVLFWIWAILNVPTLGLILSGAVVVFTFAAIAREVRAN